MSKKLSGKALVIQLGRDEVRVAQTVLGSALPQLQQCRVLPTPEGAVADGVIESPDALRDTLTGVLREPEFKRCRRAVLTLCSTQVVTETVTVPAMSSRNLEKLLQTNADTYFPVDIRDCRIVWQTERRQKNEDGKDELTLRLWAVPNSILKRCYLLLNSCGLSVAAIDYSGNSLATAAGLSFSEKTAAPKRRKLSEITIGPSKKDKPKSKAKKKKKGKAKQAENTEKEPWEGADRAEPWTAAKEAAEENGSEESAAATTLFVMFDSEHLLMTFACDGQVKLQRLVLTGQSFESSINDLRTMIEYYRSSERRYDAKMTGVLCGALAAEDGAADMLSQELDIPFKVMNSPGGPEWCLCAGAAGSRLDFGDPALNRPRKGKNGEAKPVRQISAAWQYALVLLGGLALAGSLAVTLGSRAAWNSAVDMLETTRQSVQLRAAEFSGYKSNYDTYAAGYDSYSSDWESLFSNVRTYNDNLVHIFDELEEKMPTAVKVSKIDISQSGVSLEFACDSKMDAAYMIMALRDLQYADVQSISSLSFNASTGVATAEDTEDTEGTEEAPESGSSTDDFLTALIASMSGSSSADLADLYNAYLEYRDTGVLSDSLKEIILSSIDDETLAAIEAALASSSETDYTLEELIEMASFEQRQEAVSNMLTGNYYNAYKFMQAFEADLYDEDNEDPLINVLWDDLLALDGNNEEDEALIELIESIITGEGVSLYEDDADALMEMFSRLIEILTADEEKLSATEKLIADDEYLSGQLKAALEEELGLSTGAEDVDLDAIIESYVNDGTTGNDALDEIISNAASDALGDAFTEAAVATESNSLLDEITQSISGDTTDGSSSGSSAASGAAGPITFTVQLSYKPALLAEEQVRKGLDADAIIEKLEVETE